MDTSQHTPTTPKSPVRYSARCTWKQKVSAKVYVSHLTLVHPKEIEFVAGQTILLHVADGQNRSMSVASPPFEKYIITMAYDVSPMGVGSQWMLRLKVGDPVEFLGPLGIFTLRPSSRKKVLVATGTGIAPFRSMLHQELKNGSADDFTVFWGVRYEEDIFWYDEFMSMVNAFPNLHLNLTLSQPSSAWAGLSGRVTAHIVNMVPNLPECDYYLCGNGSMVEDVTRILTDHGVSRQQIFSERFFGKNKQ